MKVPHHHTPRHAHHEPRHARGAARRRTGPTLAWVGVLALVGFASIPEPSAPAAQLADHPVVAAVHALPMSVDEAHAPWRVVGATAPAPAPVAPLGARWGVDIGWPQCGHSLPDLAVDFAIVQVTSGRPGTVSPCLAAQAAWARSVGSVLNAYVVPGSPSAADLAAADASGSCRGDRSCRLRAAGAADAAHALAGAAAAGLEARGWWLDVEDVPERTLWSTDTAANAQVLAGWRDALRRAGKQVGVYSTRGYWRQVAGRWQPDLPQWVAVGLAGVDAAARACGRPFTEGPVLLGQWLTGPLDGNRLCPGHDRLARQFFGSFTRARTAGVPDLLVIPVPHPDIEAAAKAQAEREAAQAAADDKAEEQRAKEKAARKARQARADARAKSGTGPGPGPGPRPAPTPTPSEPPAPTPQPSEPAPAPSQTATPPPPAETG